MSPRRTTLERVSRTLRGARSLVVVALVAAACDVTGDVGEYTDGGARCDPLAARCGPGRACSLRPDPREDACRDSGGVAMGAPCVTADACVAGSQCVVVDAARATLVEAGGGACARVCARDAPSCPPGETCVDLLAGGGGVRIDYGVCAP